MTSATATRLSPEVTEFFKATGPGSKSRIDEALREYVLRVRKLKRREIATVLSVPQPKVSTLKNYRLDQFSVERLMEFLTALNQDVEIMIRPHYNTTQAGHISVLEVQS